MQSKIGFIIDYKGQEIDHLKNDVHKSFPTALYAAGLNQNNCLCWTFDHFKWRALDSGKPTPTPMMGQPYAKTVALLNDNIIQGSKLQIVFLCGPDASASIMEYVNQQYKEKVKAGYMRINRIRYKIYLELGSRQRRPILYVEWFDLAMDFETFNSGKIASLTELIKFAATVTGLHDIKPFYLECGLALRWICIQCGFQARGNTPIHTKDLSNGMNRWLDRHGLVSADMNRLGSHGTTMIGGLLIFLSYARAYQFKQKTPLVTESTPPKQAGTQPPVENKADRRGIPESAYTKDAVDLAVRQMFPKGFIGNRSAFVFIKLIFDAKKKQQSNSDGQEIINLNGFKYGFGNPLGSLMDRLESIAEISNTGIQLTETHVTRSKATNMLHRLPRAIKYKSTRNLGGWQQEAGSYWYTGYKAKLHNSACLVINYIHILIPQDIYESDFENTVTFFIEISEEGIRPLYPFMPSAPLSDPAHRVAFRIIFTRKSDRSTRLWYARMTFRNENEIIFKLNTLVDRLTLGADSRTLLNTARRHVVVASSNDPSLQPFVGRHGTFTSQLFQNQTALGRKTL